MSDNPKKAMNSYTHTRILADSKILRRIHPLISCVSPTNMPVMLIGETGTWKPLFARLIHNNSIRKNKKFIAIDISNSNKNSLENNIFGQDYEDSKLSKIGKLEQANGGSILLNEIGEIPEELQLRLLQVIQNREFHRIGGNKAIPIDVRIIATASENLESDVKQGNFRKDLYYRMAVFPIIISPLRESRHDIKIFADRILNIVAKKIKKQLNGISSEAMKVLVNYDWPQNFSELEEAIKYAVNLEKTSEIQISSLPEKILNGNRHLSQIYQINTNRILTLEEIERQALIHAMKVTGNNVQLAADALRINRATVYRKLGKYNLLESRDKARLVP